MGMTLERYEERDAEIIRGAILNMPASGPLFANAGEAAAEGSRLVSSLRETVGGANGWQDMLKPASIEQTRRRWGDAAAEQMVTRLTATVASYGRFLEQDAREIGQKFTVSGTLVQRDEAGRWSLGAFAIETRVGGVGVRIGSDAVARTSPIAKPGAPTATPATTQT